MTINVKSVLYYMTMPDIYGRSRYLLATGFQFLAFFVALVYQSVRLLPKDHPYLDPSNLGRFGLRQVIAEAANHLEFSKKNIDKIIVFFVILLAVFILIGQFLILLVGVIIPVANATMPTGLTGFFTTAHPEHDLAFMMLDMVFGVPNFFNSCVSNAAINCQNDAGSGLGAIGLEWAPGGDGWLSNQVFPYPIHLGLHQLFQAYSLGLLVVASFLMMYFMVTVVAETAQTGTPFGKRYNKVWAPFRIIIAIAMLMPISYGFNGSQYLVLNAAKFGSGFATNGWSIFLDTLLNGSVSAGTVGGGVAGESMVAVPSSPEVGSLLQFLFIAKTCEYAYAKGQTIIMPYVVAPWQFVGGTDTYFMIPDNNGDPTNSISFNGGNWGNGAGQNPGGDATGSFVYNHVTYEDMKAFVGLASLVIVRFGEVKYVPATNSYEPINDEAACGEIVFKMSDPRMPNDANNPPDRGVDVVQHYYWYAWQEMYHHLLEEDYANITGSRANYPWNHVQRAFSENATNAAFQGVDYAAELNSFYTADFPDIMSNPSNAGLDDTTIVGQYGLNGAIAAMQTDPRWNFSATALHRGWGGAGIWYNKVAQLNGSFIAAANAMPTIRKFPRLMRQIAGDNKAVNAHVTSLDMYNPAALAERFDKQANFFGDPNGRQMANAMYEAYRYWADRNLGKDAHIDPGQNEMIDFINRIFGTSGLFNMRANDNVHPLAKLVGVGRSLVEAAILNFYTAAGATAAGIATETKTIDSLSQVIIQLNMSMLSMTLSIGFVLYYILPFMPFLYFFFALSGWIKGIFEAMVGAPLWALAHIRIDGNGLPGQAAMSGYYLVLEVFLRPILIVFGLIASISIFAASVSVLDSTWDLVVANVGGFDVDSARTGASAPGIVASMRGPIDEFFYTVLYTMVVYMMGMSSFKLIDDIPKSILRWMGSSVTSFNDQREDPAQGVMSRANVTAQQAVGGVSGALGDGMKRAVSGQGQVKDRSGDLG